MADAGETDWQRLQRSFAALRQAIEARRPARSGTVIEAVSAQVTPIRRGSEL